MGGLIQGAISSADGTARFVYQPVENLVDSSIPFVSAIASRTQKRAKRRRQTHILNHGVPLISVVMPMHNAESTVGQAIESLLGQDHGNLEILVVNDASVDRSVEIVEALAKRDSRVSLRENTLGRGAALARNVGMNAAQGKYLSFQDSDDVSTPMRLEEQLELLLRDDRAILSRCDYCRVDADGRPVSINGRVVSQSIISMMFDRRKVLDRIGYMQDIPVSEDFEYYRRINLVFGKHERHVYKCHYLAGFDSSSLLFSDGDTHVEGSGVLHTRSEDAQVGLAAIDCWHKKIKAGADPYVGVKGIVRAP